jgi:hypothetical protein
MAAPDTRTQNAAANFEAGGFKVIVYPREKQC